jgi:hypothetical protein
VLDPGVRNGGIGCFEEVSVQHHQVRSVPFFERAGVVVVVDVGGFFREVVSVLGFPLCLALFLWLVGLTWAAWCAGRGLVRAPAVAGRPSCPGGRSSLRSGWSRS